jgi:FkbM family methyltransferase
VRSISITERVRQVIRAFVPRQVYACLAMATDAAFCTTRLGMAEYLRLRSMRCASRCASSPNIRQTVFIPRLLHPIQIRPGTTDVDELIYTTIRETYGVYLPTAPVHSILDAGANIGDSTCWYLSRFPDARVIALEPDSDNFELLRINCRSYGKRAVLLHAALWDSKACLHVQGSCDCDAISVLSPASHTVRATQTCEAFCVSDILNASGIDILDILKCDIEGAERQVFSAPDATQWLKRTRCVVIEVHSPECLDAVLKPVLELKFTHKVYRNLHILVNRAL